eukprot:6195978-Pleurochrysis_carterae.AAC.5
MGSKKQGRSLASRKRAKDVSKASLEHALSYDPSKAEPFKAAWETDIPKKLKRMLQHAQRLKEGKHNIRHRESGPGKPKALRLAEKQKQETGDASGMKASVRSPAAPTLKGQGAVVKANKSRKDQSAGHMDTPAHIPKVPQRPAQKGKDNRGKRKPRFGETNDQPPDLVLIGQLAKKIRR